MGDWDARIIISQLKKGEKDHFVKTAVNKKTEKVQIKLSFTIFFLYHFSLIQQQNSYGSAATAAAAATALNETLSAVNIGFANCTLMNDRAVTNGLNVGTGIVLNYPYAINQPFLVNYYARTPIQAQYPAIYYYFPSLSNLYQSQYVLINTEHQHTPIASIQVNDSSSSSSCIDNVTPSQAPVNREVYEKYNISFNDALWIGFGPARSNQPRVWQQLHFQWFEVCKNLAKSKIVADTCIP